MLLQNTLDLSTFEIVRFRIWNQTSQPSDRGFGSKYFNTNSGHEAYCREEIFTPIGWRTAAYMDDIDKINEKLDLIFGDELDTDTIIDSWKEVQDFLSGIEDTKNLMTMLDGKLDKTGGTIYKDGNNNPLTIKATSEYAGLGFKIGENGRAILAYYGDFDWRVTNESYQAEAKILHNLNFESIIGDTYLKTDGSNKMEAPLKLFSGDISTVNYHGLFVGTANISDGAAFNYGAFISIPDRGTSQLQLSWYRSYHSPQLAIRLHESNNWSDWKTIAFTDSTVAAAYKLVKSTGTEIVTIDDNGTTNFAKGVAIAQNATFNPTYGIIWRIAETDITNVSTGSTGNFILGNGGAAKGYKTYLDGGTLYFRTYKDGASQTAMTITDGGNVLVGRSSNAFGARISALGLVHIEGGASSVSSIGDIPANGLTIGYDTLHIMAQWVHGGNGSGNIQAMRVDSNKKAYALNLNPLGGAVNVGEGGLNVAGIAAVATTLTVGASDGTSTAAIFLQRTSSNYIWANKEGGSLVFGVKDAGSAWSQNASLSIHSNNVRSGDRNNAVSLGTSTYRWSDVYSVNGDFNGRVLIGNISSNDIDENAILQWSGTAKSVNATYGNIEIRTARGLSWHVPASLSSWTRGLYAYNNSNSTPIGIFGFKGAEQVLEYAFIGNSATSPWFTINSTESNFKVLTKFNGGALIPTGQTLTIGSVTFRETAAGEVEVDGNLHTTGTLASGGKGEAGENTTGNAMVYQYDLASGESVYTVDNVKGSTNVIVQIFEWNSNTSSWDMILTDVSVKADAITVTFGRTTTVNHMVTVC